MKVTDTKGANAVGKKKKTSRKGKAGDVSFASMVEAASGVEQTQATEATQAVTGVDSSGHEGAKGHVPEDAAGRSSYMLDQLEELEKDILTGDPTDALEKLKDALATEVIDRDRLSPRMQQLVDEIDLRVSVEIAKMEESSK